MSSASKKNLPASVLARLKNIAVKQKFNFNILLIRYGVERFLYRLSVSPYSSSFVLKGATFFKPIIFESTGTPKTWQAGQGWQ